MSLNLAYFWEFFKWWNLFNKMGFYAAQGYFKIILFFYIFAWTNLRKHVRLFIIGLLQNKI